MQPYQYTMYIDRVTPRQLFLGLIHRNNEYLRD